VVSIDLIMRAIAINIEGLDLELIESSVTPALATVVCREPAAGNTWQSFRRILMFSLLWAARTAVWRDPRS